MVADCGKEWTERIISLKESVKSKQKQSVFQPITFEDLTWPFDKRKQVASFPP